MEKTSVDWLINNLTKHFVIKGNSEMLNKIIEQAKQMKKQQLYNFYVQGGIDGITEADRTVEDYYNETFNK
jgi:hypothetical protein